MEFDQSLEEWAKQKPLSILQLDSADRAVLRIADERDAIQKKTFTKWVNKHLSKCGKRVGDLFDDLRDGHNLVSLLEVLAGEHLPRERGRMRFHMLQNVQTVLDFLRYRKIKLVNIRAEDIVDGNPKLTLGLIWTIILHFQISDIVVGMEENVSAKDALLKWAQKSTAKYPGVRVSDFTKSWKDGLAFNAIIHRNRPDLIDWRNITRRSPRERLETAFNVAERECGVVKLLDPEDVDTHEPDEKSLITYISSLYDAFPEPPRLHPLYDTGSQKKVDEYRDIATNLYSWMRQSVNTMQDRHFPPSLIDMRKQAAEMNRFRVEEVPSRSHDKSRLTHIFRDVEKHFRDGELEGDLHLDNIERQWQILMHAHQEKDQAIHEEIKKMEKLQRLAEKIHREGKQVEIRLDEIEQRIEEEARRIDRLHPLDAKHNCDQLERDMQMTEDTIKSMFSDAQTLKEGRFHQAHEIQKMVQQLHQRWINIRSLLHNRLLSVLASISFPVEEKSITRTSKTVMETRLVDTNQHFRVLQEVSDWVKQKQKALNDSDYGSDLPSVQAELDKQQREHRAIEKFQSNVDKCSSSKSSFHGEELQLYINHLNTIQKAYSDLLMSSRKRHSDLETLVDFVQSATNELIWLSEKEEREITRDWSSKNINLVEIEQYYESLMSELEKREIQFNAVQDRGESLVLQHHPASKCIETYMSAMQTQWAWLLQLTICLETHLKHVAKHQQYFSDIRECEQTVARKEEMLNTIYSRAEFTLDEGEILLKEMQDMREDLTKYGDIIQSISNQSRDIIPLKQRKMNVTRPNIVTAVCNYKQNNQQMVINRDERCTLIDNSQRVRWRVTNSSGLEGMVPGVCFLIPPPDKEALDAADRLRRQYDRAVTMWQKKQLKMRQNMIFATIKVVKSWDLSQFLAMGAEQRNAIRKALNEDAEKLIQEGDPSDPALRRLRREIDEVNRLFDEFERRALESEKAKVVTKNFSEQVVQLQQDLEEMERTIVSRVNASVAKDVDSLERLFIEHRDFESKIHTFESRVHTVQRTYSSMSQKSSSIQSKVEKVVEKWEKVYSLSNLYVERLKSVELVLNAMEETKTYVSQFEMKLSSFDNLPVDDDGLKRVSNDLYNLQNTAQAHQHVVDRMVDNSKSLRRVTEKSRPSQKRHPDLERIEDDVHRVSSRWTSSCTQIVERIKTVEITSVQASQYNSSYSREMNWLDSVDSKTKSLPLVEGSGAKRKLNPHMTLYNSVIEEKITIEQVNTMGARLAKEARTFDAIVDTYRESMEEVIPNFNSSLVKRAKVQSAEETIFQELDLLNLKYQLTVDNLHHRLQQLSVIARQEDPSFEMPKVPAPSPIQTYRSHIQSAREATHDLKKSQGEDEVDFVQKTSSAMITLSPGKSPTKKPVVVLKNGTSHSNGSKEEDSSGDVRLGGIQFTQIRSGRRIERVEEGISTETATQVPVIRDPLTGDSLTLAQAIGCGLIDIKTGEFVDHKNNQRLSLQEAAEKGYIDPGILHKLMGLCGLVDPQTGQDLTLLEAIRRGYYDLSKGVFIHPQTGEPITPEQAIRLGLSTKQKETEPGDSVMECDSSFLPSSQPFTLPPSSSSQSFHHSSQEIPLPSKQKEAQQSESPSLLEVLNSRKIDFQSGVIQDSSTAISLTAAAEAGLITPSSSPIASGWPLSDLLDQGLITTTEDEEVTVKHIFSGTSLTLQEAIDSGVLNPNVTEVYDPSQDRRVSVSEAIESGVLDSKSGKWSQKLPLPIAHTSSYIMKPLSLKEACDMELVEEHANGVVTIFDPVSTTKRPILESVATGTLDIQSKTIFDTSQGKGLSLEEALLSGVVTPEGRVIDTASKNQLSLDEAVKKGLLTTTQRTSIFKVPCVTDVEHYVDISVPEAIKRDIINPTDPLQQAHLIHPQIRPSLVAQSGIASSSDKDELSVLEAIAQNKILPSGEVFDENSQSYLSINEAVDKGVVDPEKAEFLKSLYNITVTSANVTNTKKHLVKVKSQEVSSVFEDITDGRVSSPPQSPVVHHVDAALTQRLGQSPTAQLNLEAQSQLLQSAIGGEVNSSEVMIKDARGNVINVNEAIQQGYLDKDTGLVEANGRKITIAEAIKIGALAVVAAPLLAINAVCDAVSKNNDNDSCQKQPTKEKDLSADYDDAEPLNTTLSEDVNVTVEKSLTKLHSSQARHEEKEKVKAGETSDGGKGSSDSQVSNISSEDLASTMHTKSRILSEEIVPVETISTTSTTTTTTIIVTKISRKKIPASEAVEYGLIDQKTASDLSNKANFAGPDGSTMELLEAIQLGKIDGDTGAILDPLSEQLLTINEALKSNILDKDGNILLPVGRSVTVPELKVQGLFDPVEERVIHPETGSSLTMSEAIAAEVLYPNSPVVDPDSKTRSKLTDALKKNVVSNETGSIRTKDGEEIPLIEAIDSGSYAQCTHPLSSQLNPVAMSMNAAVRRGLVDSEGTTITNPTTGERIPISDALQQGKLTMGTGQTPSLPSSPPSHAKTTKELNSPGQKAKLSVTLKEPNKVEKKKVLMGEDQKDEAASLSKNKSHIISTTESLEEDPEQRMAEEALKTQPIEITCSSKQSPDLPPSESELIAPAPSAFIEEDDELLPMSKPFPLHFAVAQGKYNPETGLVMLEDSKEYVTVMDAIQCNEIDAYALTCKDPRNGQVVSLDTAISTGLINPKTGHAIDPVTGTEMPLDEAQEAGLLIKPSRRTSLPSVIYSDQYDPSSNTIMNSSGEAVPLKTAIENNAMILSTTLVRNFATDSILPFRTAVSEGVVDLTTGAVTVAPKTSVNIRDAFESGVLIEVHQPLSLSETFMKGLYKTGETLPVVDPQTGKGISLKDALTRKVIDSDSVHVKDTREGFVKKMPLKRAMEEGFVSEDNGTVTDFATNTKVTLEEAMESGLVIDSRRPISLQKGLHLGLYSEDTGRLTDPNTGKTITLHESIRRLVVNPNLPCVWDEGEKKLLSLVETCRTGIIDRHEGLFNVMPKVVKGDGSSPTEPEATLTLPKALEEQHIIDIEKPFGLYQALKIGLYENASGKFVHPSTGKRLTLEDSCKEDLIDPSKSVVKRPSDKKLFLLPEAIKQDIVDPVAGRLKVDKGKIPLDEARTEGLILTVERPLSIVDVVEEHLYNPQSGKIADPLLCEWLTPSKALKTGLIDGPTSAAQNLKTQNIKSFLSALDEGDIDDDRGIIIDYRNGKPTPFHRAVEQGILVKVPKPITFAEAIRNELIDLKRGTFFDPRTSITSSLRIAVMHELIEAGSAVVKVPGLESYINLRQASLDGIVDLDRRGLVEPSSKKLKQLCIFFDQGTIVFIRESVSFDSAKDKGLLNMKTGKFNDPNSHDEEPITLKEAIDIHAIDPNSVVIRDKLKKRLLTLPESFDLALIDPNSSSILDTATGHAVPFDEAFSSGLLLSPRSPLGLLDALDFSMYDPVTGQFQNPYGDRNNLSLRDAIDKNIIDPSTTMVKAPLCKKILSISEALAENIIDGDEGYFLDESTNTRHNLLDAWKKGWLLPAEARLAIEAQYKQCDATLHSLNDWLSEVERKLSAQESLRETVEEIKRQSTIIKQIHDDVEDHSQMVTTCLDQVRHLVATGGDVLSTEEINTLEKNGKVVKQRFECVSNFSENLFRQITMASDELKKYKAEVGTFKSWMDKSIRVLEEKERNISNLSSSGRDNTKEFVSDVIAHQGDLRFITMSAQKFIEESREYLQTLNQFRTNLPQRLPYLESRESTVKHEVHEITTVYQDLLARANRLFDRLAQLGNKQKDFQDALNKAMAWLKEITPRVQKVLSEPTAGEPKLIEDQLHRAKSLQNEILSNGRLIEAVRQASNNLLSSMEELSPSERDAVEMTTSELEKKYQNMLEAVSEKIKDLDSALGQSQGLQDAVDNVANWLTQAEYQLKNINKPASLIRERLDEQLREVKMLQADIESHRASIENMARSADEVLRSRNASVSKKVDSKLKDVLSRYEKLVQSLFERSSLLNEVSASLDSFLLDANQFEQWFSEMFEALDRLAGEDAVAKLEEIMRRKESRKRDFEETIAGGKALVSRKDVTDTGPVKDKIKALENQWKDLGASIEEKLRFGKTRQEALNAYEKLRDQVVKWLANMEGRVTNLQAVAVDIEMIKQQENELKPLIKEHRDYNSTIDKVNELGNAYDALLRGGPESPRRKTAATSPVKRPSFRSTDGRSPSPSKTVGYDNRSPMSPSGSSGFGSRRSSQEGFLNLEDSSPVQQQLNEINHRYNLLGMKLNDRQSDIDATREEVKKIGDNLKALSQFLDKAEKALPKESIPHTKEEADKMLKAIKAVLEDLYDKQGLLDNTRTLISDLLRRKPNAGGVDSLQHTFEGINQRWKDLQDKCKQRVSFLEHVKEFHDSHDNLHGWLNAKDKMLGVLGPVASDPRLVQSQMQQVQVMRDEFRNQKPVLDAFNNAGDNILAQTHADSPDGRKVEDKLASINQRWNDLLHKLDEREGVLDAASNASKDFFDNLNKLQDNLHKISDDLDDLAADKGDPEEMLKKLVGLERNLNSQRPILADVEAAGAELCDILQDPAAKADIKQKLGQVGRLFNQCQKKLDNLKAELENSKKDVIEFNEACAAAQDWLAGMLAQLSDKLMVSADRDILFGQISEFEPIYKEIMSREHEIIMTLNKGKELHAKSSRKPEQAIIQQNIEKVQKGWEKLKKMAVDRHTRLQTCNEHCKKYDRAREPFLTWLTNAEDRFEKLRLTSYKKPDIDKLLKEVNAFKNDIWRRSGEYESTRALGETFLGSCDKDKDGVKHELQEMKERWEALNNAITAKAQELEDAAAKLNDFNDNCRDLKNALNRCDDKLSNDSLDKDPKVLQKIKGIHDELKKLEKPLDNVRRQGEDLCGDANRNSCDDAHIRGAVDDLMDKFDSLNAKLGDRFNDLEAAQRAMEEFKNIMKAIGADIGNLENELNAMKPIGRDIPTVKTQIREIEAFGGKLHDKTEDLSSAAAMLEDLIRKGIASDPKGMKDNLDSLRKQLSRIEERAKQRASELDKTLARLEGFYNLYNTTNGDIDDLIQREKSFGKGIGGDVNAIRAQQAQFKEFRQRYVEAVAKKVDECNKSGQGLIQSAAHGVNTTILEKDLEKMNDKWNALKERINEQERKLDLALLQSGKFREALDGLDKWLSEMEELVANQKPPSADYKVVKAQLQEQKFLNKMLLDRQPSVTSLFQMGKEIAANAEPNERAQIEKQMNNMKDRYGNLCDGAKERQGLLEDAMKIAKAFGDKLGPLEDWLDQQSKKLKDMSVIPTDEDKIARRIKEHDSFHDGLLRKQPEFSELAEIADALMNLVGDEDATGVADKLQEVTDRYGHLVEESEALGQLLRQAKLGLRNLVLSYEELVAWMDTIEKRLSKYKVLSVHKEKLVEQMQQLTGITEEIKSREKQVDDTVEAGLDLMKGISSEEAIQLKDKLDSLQRRFNDITNKASDLLRNAQEALPLVIQFHENHGILSEWMSYAEDALKGLDNANLAAQEKVIVHLEADIIEQRKVLEIINLVGPQLCQLSPGEGASTIEGLVIRDNRRFDAICEQVQRRAERIQLAKARSKEVLIDIDELLDWFREIEGQLRDAEKPSCEPDIVRVQLQEHRALNDEINSQKIRVREVLATAKKVLREATQGEDTATLREKAEDLKETMETVSKLSSDRLSALEQALPLAEHFFDTHVELNQWMDAMEDEMSILDTPTLRPDQIIKLQEKTQAFIQSLNEHKPLLDKLNKTGAALMKLCNDDDAGKVDEVMRLDNDRYNALRVALRDKQQALEKALQETSQFKDKMDGMLNALENTAEQCKNAEPISAHPEKIRDQIGDNNAIIDDVKKREDAFNAIKKQAAEVIDKAPNKNDPAVRDIKQKLDRLNSLWDQIQKLTKQRGKNLDEALALAEKFWEQLQAIMDKLDALEETLKSQEPPAVEPKAIQQQQETLKEIKRDIDKVKPEVNNCRQAGQNLLKVVGDQDKPEIKKNIEELDAAWDNITALFAKREENLINAMEKAMEFHETLQELLRFLDRAEKKLADMGSIGTDIEAVKRQIKELKDFKGEVDPMMVKVEALNRQAQELTERTSPEQAAKIKAPLAQVNRRWEDLLKGINDRNRELENALLRLGQFQHALNELMAWIEKTNKTLDTLKPVFGDPQVIEVELAKLKVVVNDIQAHQNSVDTLNDAGRQIIESDPANASKTQSKLNDLNRKWEDLQKKASDRQKELEDALREAQAFNAEIQDLLMWLSDVDAALNTSKPVGGLPETAQEQLNRFMEIYNELEANRPKVEAVLHQGQEYLKKSTEGAATNLQHNLRTLRQRWESVMNRANDKKIKLEIALKEAMEFHKAVQDFIEWLTEAERYLTGLEPVSRVLDKVIEQVESHKEFQKEVSAHREDILNLEKKGNHLKYFSQKQDVILIKNLLISVQHRWDRVVQKSTERTRALDLGLKEAKEFHDSWTSLMNWLGEAETSLDEIVATAGQNPIKIKQMLAKHKEFQRTLAAKQPAYDSTMKMGKGLKDKAPKPDEPILRQMLTDLKNKWNAVCNKSVEKQRNLEEALLRSGQFKDALQELLDWLKEMDRLLVDDSPVHGDLDTVTALIEQHKKIEEELNNRRSQMNNIIRTAEEMMETAQGEEKIKLQGQIREVQTSFDKVKGKCDRRSRRLEEALKEAEKLHKAVHILLEWLSDAEMKLRFAGQLPEDEESTKRLLDEHESFMAELKIKEREKDETIELAKSILAKAHPDAIPVIKHWISIIQSRWEEISSWAVQRHEKLKAHLNALRGMEEMLEELMAWLQKCEDTLTRLEAEPLPDDLDQILVLIKEHKEFMEGMASRQPEIDAVCKPKLVSRAPLVKGKPGARLRSATPGDSREGSPELDFAQRRLSAKTVGSRETTPLSRLDSPAREDLFPHIGPRFDRRGSKAVEPQIKNPRVKALWDKWKHVWMMAWERQRRLQDKFNYLQELEKVKNFSWEDWRKRFLKFMNHKKSRVMDLFRKIDKNNDNLIPREEFIDAIMKTKFPTSRLEMNAVADMFDHGDHLIDYMEFIAALRADWEDRKPLSEGDVIEDEIQRQVMKCTCRQKFRVFQVGEGKYRFGESQKLRLVRILRSTVMVRVGGGWVALDEFLVKNDPCRAKGRTNIELREQFILADGVSQTMTAFKSKPSGGGSTVSSGNRSAQSLPTAGPITKVKERSIRSVPMGGRARSTDRTTPESTYSDDGFSLSRTPRRTSAGPGRGSQPGSRSGSKPPSRAGSNASLDDTDEYGTRIPVRRATSLKKGTAGGFGGSPRGPIATSTPTSRPPFSLSTNTGGVRGPSTERAHSFTQPSNTTPIKRTGSSSSISSLTNSGGRPSRIPLYVGGEATSAEVLDRSRTPSNSNIPVTTTPHPTTRARTPSGGGGA